MNSLIYNKKKPILTDNILYNILNFNTPQSLFLYGVIILTGVFISINVSINYNILIGLIFCVLIILYHYTYLKYNTISDTAIENEKFNSICSKNLILSNYTDIVNFLFYFENLRSNNIQQYENLINSFENFIKIYEYCLIDNELIFKYFSNLISKKILILTIINNFIFTTLEMDYENIIIKNKNNCEELLNKYLNNLVILYKKKIYYNGYNNNYNNINYSSVLPYNILYDTNYKYGDLQYNISDLINF